MEHEPLISVVITNYNYADYVSRAIQSVLDQTYLNIELIVINDGSTDDSDEIIRAIVDKNPQIIYINQKNQGVVYSRNLGMEKARGDFLCCLDADDYFDPDYVEKNYRYIIEYDADVVYPNWRFQGDWSGQTDFPEFDFVEYQKQHLHIKPESLIRASSIKNDDGTLKYGYLPETELRANDWAYFISLAAHGLSFKLAKDNYINYTIKENSMARSFTRYEDIRIFCKYLAMLRDRFGDKIIEPIELPLDIIEQQDKSIEELTQKTEKLQQEISSRDVIIAESSQSVTNMQRQFVELQQSRSYRIGKIITSPWRILMKITNRKKEKRMPLIPVINTISESAGPKPEEIDRQHHQ